MNASSSSGNPYRHAGGGLDCPRCRSQPMALMSIEHVTVARCDRCLGVWVDRNQLEEIFNDLGLQFSVREALHEGPGRGTELRAGAPMYVGCPRCEKLMSRRRFADRAKIVVDHCLVHGIWFDQSELTAAVDFAERNDLTSLESAMKREAPKRRRKDPARPARMGSMGSSGTNFAELLHVIWQSLGP